MENTESRTDSFLNCVDDIEQKIQTVMLIQMWIAMPIQTQRLIGILKKIAVKRLPSTNANDNQLLYSITGFGVVLMGVFFYDRSKYKNKIDI